MKKMTQSSITMLCVWSIGLGLSSCSVSKLDTSETTDLALEKEPQSQSCEPNCIVNPPVEKVPQRKVQSVGLINKKQIYTTMHQRVRGTKTLKLSAARAYYNDTADSFADTSEVRNLNAPLVKSTIELAAEFCDAAVVAKSEVLAPMLTGKETKIIKAEKLIQHIAYKFWYRKASAKEVTVIQHHLKSSFADIEKETPAKLSLYICTSMLASLDSLTL